MSWRPIEDNDLNKSGIILRYYSHTPSLIEGMSGCEQSNYYTHEISKHSSLPNVYIIKRKPLSNINVIDKEYKIDSNIFNIEVWESEESNLIDTRADILSRHPEYNYIAKDYCGSWFVYKDKPNLSDDSSAWAPNGRHQCCESPKFYGSVEGSLYCKEQKESIGYKNPSFEKININNFEYYKDCKHSFDLIYKGTQEGKDETIKSELEWIAANESHIGNMALSMRVRNDESHEWINIENQVLMAINRSILKSKYILKYMLHVSPEYYSVSSYSYYKFCEVIEMKKIEVIQKENIGIRKISFKDVKNNKFKTEKIGKYSVKFYTKEYSGDIHLYRASIFNGINYFSIDFDGDQEHLRYILNILCELEYFENLNNHKNEEIKEYQELVKNKDKDIVSLETRIMIYDDRLVEEKKLKDSLFEKNINLEEDLKIKNNEIIGLNIVINDLKEEISRNENIFQVKSLKISSNLKDSVIKDKNEEIKNLQEKYEELSFGYKEMRLKKDYLNACLTSARACNFEYQFGESQRINKAHVQQIKDLEQKNNLLRLKGSELKEKIKILEFASKVKDDIYHKGAMH